MHDKKSEPLTTNGDQLPINQAPPRIEILPRKAEEYLREGGNIEDFPSPKEKAEEERRNQKRNRE